MPHVRNAWYVAAWEGDLEDAKPFAMSILGEPVVIYRCASGGLAALEDRCSHRHAPLSLGRCEGDRLRCMYHGLLFGPDGRVMEIPGQDKVPPQTTIRSYPVVARHSWVWVWMGEPAAADESLIPGAVGLDDADYILGNGQLDYAAEARLINDNLLDFSHLSYVHANSFGATEVWARSRPKVTPLPRGVRVERWFENETGMSDPLPHDRWSTYDFLVPGVLLMTGGNFPVGTARSLEFAPPDLAQATSGVTFTSQAVTPMGDRQSRYYFSWGPRADMGDAEQRDRLMGIAAVAFAEDKVMIEAQQANIDRMPPAQVVPTSADKALTLFNRLVQRLAREEAREVESPMMAERAHRPSPMMGEG